MPDTTQNRPLLGVLLVVIAMTTIGFIDNFIQLIAEDAGLWQFHLMRSALVCIVVLMLAPLFRWRLRPNNWSAVALRSFFFATSMVLYFGAAGVIPIAQAGAGLFTAPIFVLVISALFLGTKIGLWRIVAVILGFAGVILILKPNAAEFSPLTALPVLAGLFYALNGIATRRWCEGETAMTLFMGLMAALGVWGMIGVAYFALFPASPDVAADMSFFTRPWQTPTPQFLALVVLQTVGAIVAVPLLTRGYQLSEVSFVVVFEYSFLIAAAFWAYVLWGDVLDTRAALGIFAIILAGTIIALRSR